MYFFLNYVLAYQLQNMKINLDFASLLPLGWSEHLDTSALKGAETSIYIFSPKQFFKKC